MFRRPTGKFVLSRCATKRQEGPSCRFVPWVLVDPPNPLPGHVPQQLAGLVCGCQQLGGQLPGGAGGHKG